MTQRVIVCPEADKLTRLQALLANVEGKALVFAPGGGAGAVGCGGGAIPATRTGVVSE